MDKPAPAIVRLAEFAKLHSVSKAAVTKWKQRGLLVLTPDGRVDVSASNKRLADRPAVNRGQLTKGPAASDALTQSGGDPDDAWSLSEASRRDRIAVAKLRELELAEKAAKAVAVEDVEREWTAAFAAARAGVLAAPSRVAARRPNLGLDDIAVIDDELRLVPPKLAGLTDDGPGHRSRSGLACLSSPTPLEAFGLGREKHRPPLRQHRIAWPFPAVAISRRDP
jgi:phage terminase Nu1 subunit (DNA packaging protein)